MSVPLQRIRCNINFKTFVSSYIALMHSTAAMIIFCLEYSMKQID
jgi:hypothetical protein